MTVDTQLSPSQMGAEQQTETINSGLGEGAAPAFYKAPNDEVQLKRPWGRYAKRPRPVCDEIYTDGIGVAVSYGQVRELWASQNPKPSAQTLVNMERAISLWIEWLPLAPHDGTLVVGKEFTATEFQAQRSLFEEHSRKRLGVSSKTAKNWASSVGALQTFYAGWLTAQDLPTDFRQALNMIVARKGMIPQDLRKVAFEAAYGWAYGRIDPARKSRDRVAQLEKILEIPEGTLTSRMRGVIEPLYPDLPEETKNPPFNRYNAYLKKFPYRLPYRKWPKALQAVWTAYVSNKKKQRHEVGGKNYSLDPDQIWHSENTVRKRCSDLEAYFGFLLLKKPKSWEWWEGTSWTERLQHGMGLKNENLKFTDILNHEYLNRYLRYSQSRSYDAAAWAVEEARIKAIAGGNCPPPSVPVDTKSLSDSIRQLFILANNLINHPYSFVRSNYKLLKHEVPRISAKQWQKWCDKRLERTFRGDLPRWVNSNVKLKNSRRQRLSPFLREKDPAIVLHKFAARLEEHAAPVSAPIFRALDMQFIAIVNLLTWLPIRGKNICDLDIDRHLIVTGDKVRLKIPSHEVKNWIWGYAEDVDVIMPDDVAAPMLRWINLYRPLVPFADQTNAAFLRITQGGGKRNNHVRGSEAHRISRARLTVYIRDKSKMHLGAAIIPHDWRMILVSAAVRFGASIGTIKAMLGDSAATAQRAYVDAKNSDEAERIDDLHAAGRKRFLEQKKPK